MSNSFDFVAPYYDFLAHLVFGNKLLDAQCKNLKNISANRTKISVLIVGGGTGKYLRAFCDRFTNAHVTYVEASEKMLSLAKKKVKNADLDRVEFVLSKWEDFYTENIYDVLITNFFLDCFSDRTLPIIVDKGYERLARKGIWLVTDFKHQPKVPGRLLIKVMYSFFRFVSNLETRNLPDYNTLFKHSGLSKFHDSLEVNGLVMNVALEKD